MAGEFSDSLREVILQEGVFSVHGISVHGFWLNADFKKN